MFFSWCHVRVRRADSSPVALSVYLRLWVSPACVSISLPSLLNPSLGVCACVVLCRVHLPACLLHPLSLRVLCRLALASYTLFRACCSPVVPSLLVTVCCDCHVVRAVSAGVCVGHPRVCACVHVCGTGKHERKCRRACRQASRQSDPAM